MAQPPAQVSPDQQWAWNGTQWVPNAPTAPASNQPSWARAYEPAGSLARWAVLLIVANLASEVLLTLALVVGVDFAPASPDDTQALVLGVLLLTAIAAYVGTFIPAVVLFCMWLHRAVGNMPALGSPDARWSPAGAVGRCFIPFLNLAHPLLGALDAWRGADASGRHLDLVARKRLRAPGVMVGWWALWLIAAYLGRASSEVTGSSGAVLDALAGAASVAAGVLAILVVQRLTARQELKHQLIETGRL
jgi:hypothetical protein